MLSEYIQHSKKKKSFQNSRTNYRLRSFRPIIVTRNYQYDLAYLNRKITSIYIIPKKKVLCSGRQSPDFKQLHQVIKLTMDITTH